MQEGQMELRFTVGEKEKHQVEVDVSYWTGKERIYVDGKLVVDKTHWGFSSDHKFQVGDAEKHEVEVKASGLFTPKIKVFVDSKLYTTG
jgi:hypothetical protein